MLLFRRSQSIHDGLQCVSRSLPHIVVRCFPHALQNLRCRTFRQHHSGNLYTENTFKLVEVIDLLLFCFCSRFLLFKLCNIESMLVSRICFQTFFVQFPFIACISLLNFCLNFSILAFVRISTTTRRVLDISVPFTSCHTDFRILEFVFFSPILGELPGHLIQISKPFTWPLSSEDKVRILFLLGTLGSVRCCWEHSRETS